mmetsp:Transcript_47438/g.92579  ORF Transcript_47438/g.92579 Transcript_47438/m.92579 type:complete len:534 (-) Transcript_47438:1092-2693(-)
MVGVVRQHLQEPDNMLRVRHQQVHLPAILEPLDNPRVRLQDTLTQPVHVLHQILVVVGRHRVAGLQQHRQRGLQVVLEPPVDRQRHVPDTAEDVGFDGAVEVGILQIFQQCRHNLVAVRLDGTFDRTGDVPDHTRGDTADLVGFGVFEAHQEEGVEVGHVDREMSLEFIGEGGDREVGLPVGRGVARLKDVQEVLHNGIGKGTHVRPELLGGHLDHPTQQPLQLFLGFLVFVGEDGHGKGRLEPFDNQGQHLHQDGAAVLRGVLDEHIDRLVGAETQVGFLPVLPFRHLQERLQQLAHVGREGVGRAGLAVERRREIVQGETRLAGHVGALRHEDRRQSLHETGEGLVGNTADVQVADPAEGPGAGVLDEGVGVREGTDQHRDGLVDVGADFFGGGSLEDGGEGHGGRLAHPPFRVLDVLQDEGHNDIHHLVLHGVGHEGDAGGSRHGQVPVLVVVHLLILFGEGLHEQRNEMFERRRHVVGGQPHGRNPLFRQIRRLVHNINLLFAQSRPELHRLHGHLVVPPRHRGKSELR